MLANSTNPLDDVGQFCQVQDNVSIAGEISNLAARYPKLQSVVRDRRWVDNGKIITTAGLSAGMDGALHVVDRWMGRLDAKELARGVEYDWVPARKDSYGTLVANKMPMWHMVVPESATFERYSEEGDSKRWETRIRTEFAMAPKEFLDHSAKRLQEEGWVPKASGAGWRSYQRTEEGQRWEMKTRLTKGASADAYDFSVAIQRVGKAGA